MLFVALSFFCNASFHTLKNEHNLSLMIEKVTEQNDSSNTPISKNNKNNKNINYEENQTIILASTQPLPIQENVIEYIETPEPKPYTNPEITSQNNSPDNSTSPIVITLPQYQENAQDTPENSKINLVLNEAKALPNESNTDAQKDVQQEPTFTEEVFLEDVSVHAEELQTPPSPHLSSESPQPPSPPSIPTQLQTQTQAQPSTSTELHSYSDIERKSNIDTQTSFIDTQEPLTQTALNNSEDNNNQGLSNFDHELMVANNEFISEGEDKTSLLSSYHKLNRNENFSPFLEAGLNPAVILKSTTFSLKKSTIPSSARITLAKNQTKSFYYKIGGARIQWATWSSN